MSAFRLSKTASRQAAFRPITRPLSTTSTHQQHGSNTNTHPAFQARTYASDNSSPNASNARDSPSASPESQGVNASRATENDKSPDSASLAKPMSNPEEGGLGLQEEQQPSQENMKSDPSEPDHVKRAKVEKEGQKPLDAADK